MARFSVFKSSRNTASTAEKHQSNGNGALDVDRNSKSHLPYSQIKRATRTRFLWSVATSTLLFITVIFLIMTEIGNTSNRSVLRDIWFIKLDLTNVVPSSVPNATILNTIARTLGLHDFYQVGLWNYCEGYNGQGVTQCMHPRTLYWFNPVQLIQSQLLAGSSISLPDELNSVLHLIHFVSRVMFAFFLTGACLSFVLMFVTWTSIYSRWAAFAMVILTFINAALIAIAAAIATAMWIIMRNVFNSADQVNIVASVGVTMFAMFWTATACAIIAFIIELCLMCCCASRRDVRRGKKKGSKKAYTT